MKRSVGVDANGGPLGVVIAGANVHDAKLLKRTLQAIVVPKPRPTSRKKQHLCLDKGYDNPSGRAAAVSRPDSIGTRRIFVGSAKRSWTAAAAAIPGPPLGRGAHVRVVEQVPCASDSVRQAFIELPWTHPVGLRLTLVPAIERFEIVT
ncbi:MAG: transposase [Planctomycetes bacterium]|nr:transposase [Planctomycetota bacterium]